MELESLVVCLGLLIPCLFSLGSSDGTLFSNSWAVEIRGGPDVADMLARKHGFANKGQVGERSSVYHFVHVLSPSRMKRELDDPHPVLFQLKSENQIGYVEHQIIKKRHKREQLYSYFPPTNGDWKKQWYLHRSNGHDMNVERVWEQGVTGRGAVVSILDDGIEHNHPDLRENYDPQASYDFNSHDADPIPRYDPTNENKHGTRCAGEVAARKDGHCGIGVAFGSTVGGVRMLDGDVTDVVEASSLSLKPQHIHIYSSSWGPNDDGATVDGPGKLASKAFVDGVTYGRNGLGSIFVWAAGNGGRSGDSCNCDGYAVSPLTISVGSASASDKKPWYLEMCSSTLTSTYSSGGVGEKQIVTTDIRRTCTDRHTGTSASAPLAAGMIALALEVNSNLTWRDMQYLMVYASNPQYPVDDHWQVNGAGLRVSHWYGFGIIDGTILVNRARNWITVPERTNCTVNVTNQFSDQHTTATGNSPVSLKIEVARCSIVYLEHVQAIASIRVVNGMRKDISIHLTSPSGTKSTLLPFRPRDRHKDGFHLWPFMTVHSWGEKPLGNWIFEISLKAGSKVALQSLELVFFGTESVPQAVSVVPSKCHPECLGGCANTGPQYCDMCRHFQIDKSLECVASCPAGTFTNKNTCRSCPPLCAECVDSKSCSRCQPKTFQLLNGNCSSECSNGTFVSSNNSCILCHQSCLTCDGPNDTHCTSCQPQLVLEHNSCVMRESTPCPDGRYFDHRAHECKQCHGSCATCMGKGSAQCTSCFEGNQLNQQGQCIDARLLRSCSFGQYFDGSISDCLPCPPACTSCSDEVTCLACQHGLYLNQHGACVQVCSVQTNTDVECVNLTCHHSCLTCFGPEPSQCNSCSSDLLLHNKSCVGNCPLGFYRQNQTCRACHTSCKSCISSSLSDDCLSCSSQRFLNGQKCVAKCPSGSFSKDNVCLPCMSNCSQCVSLNSCHKCSDGFHLLLKSRCVSHCPTGYVLHKASQSCVRCPMHCVKCVSASSCLVCKPEFVYYAPSGSCLSVCPSGYYSSNGQCLQCQSPCSTCATSAFNCSTCLTGMVLDMTSQTCQECCNPDRPLTSCCDCEQSDQICYWVSGLNNSTTSTLTTTSASNLAMQVGLALTVACLLVFFLVLLLVMGKFYYSKNFNRKYHMLPNQENLDIVGDSGSDVDLYIPDGVVS